MLIDLYVVSVATHDDTVVTILSVDGAICRLCVLIAIATGVQQVEEVTLAHTDASLRRGQSDRVEVTDRLLAMHSGLS
jgi:hypothetical protein